MDIITNIVTHNNRPGTPVFNHGSSQPQVTDFPKYMLDYIISNPKSPKQWKKIIQTCKLFFDKNPIVVIQCLHFHGYIYVGNKTVWYTCLGGYCKSHQNREIKIFDVPFKLWVTENVYLLGATNAPSVIPQLYKCDAKKLVLYRNIKFDDLLFLSSNAVDIRLDSSVIDKNGKIVPLEKIVERLPASLERMEYYINQEDDITPDTFLKLSEMETIQKLKKMKFRVHISTPSDLFKALFNFMLENKQINFEVDLATWQATDEQKLRVQDVIAQLNGENYGSYQRPKISFIGPV